MTSPRAASELIARAPGKLVIAGEYAVTRGHAGLVAATDRYAVARAWAPAPAPTPTTNKQPSRDDVFVRAAMDVLSAAFGEASAAVATARATQIDTSALYEAELKLGLGSSAAATVALIARAYAHQMPDAGANASKLRDGVYPLARAAHANAQASRGASGSGIDVAAACLGGFLQFEQGIATAVPAPPVAWLAVYTGASASTPLLLAAVAEAEQRTSGQAVQVTHAIDELANVAARMIAACHAQDASAFIDGIAAGHRAMHQLASATGLALVPPVVDHLAKLAATLGGAAKTTGAGGGDVALVAVPLQSHTAMLALLQAQGIPHLALALGGPGVQVGDSTLDHR